MEAVFSTMVSSFTGVFSFVVSSFTGVSSFVILHGGRLFEAVSSMIISSFTGVSSFVVSSFTGVSSFVVSSSTGVSSFVILHGGRLFEAVSSMVVSSFMGVSSFTGVFSFIVSSFTGWANRLIARARGGIIRAVGTNEVKLMVPEHRTTSDPTVENFLREIANDNPVRFSQRQLAEITRNYSAPLGAGGFGDVYRGTLPNGVAVAVKVLRGHDGRRSAEQSFMAEVGTIGRTHHVNLVRLFGFCFDGAVRALVYEFMERGSLDSFLLTWGNDVGMRGLLDIAVGVARGIRYLHEECSQKIVHYDIKPGNILLDGKLTPKVADFGLARLVNPAATHITVSGVRGTPGYAAPEMWMQSGVTEKCDVYSFGMLLLEIVGRRRNFDEAAPESQQWFPKLAWMKYETDKLIELVDEPLPTNRGSGRSVDDDGEALRRKKEMVERMCKTAFWCVQQLPEARPPIGVVVKMLEGETDIPPPVNPFPHMMASPASATLWTTTTVTGGDTVVTTNGWSERSGDLISL